MGQHNIDQYFKRRLSSHSEDINTDALWNQIDSELPSRSGFSSWWIPLSLGILLVGAITFKEIFFYGQETEASETIAQVRKSNNSVQQYQELTTENQSIDQAQNSKTTTKTVNSKTETKTSNNNALAVSTEDKKTSKEKSTFNPTTQTNQLVNKTKEKQGIGTEAVVLSPSTSDIQILKPTSADKVEEKNKKIPTLLDGVLEVDKLTIQTLTNNRFDLTNLLTLLPSKAQKKITTDFSVYGSYNLVRRDLTTTLPNLNEFISWRNASEEVLNASTIGASFRFKLQSGLYARVGLEALDITERFELTVESVIVNKWSNLNHHRLLSIPFGIGYEVQRGRWSYFLESGFQYNLSYQFKGFQIDTPGIVTPEPKSSDRRFKDSYTISGGVAYKLRPRVSIYLQPRYQSTFNTNTRVGDLEVFPISEKYGLYGVLIGLNYTLD